MAGWRACGIACFGPGEGYFFNSPGSWHTHNLPEGIQKLFDRGSIKDVYMMAIAPGENTNSYIMTYQDALRNQLLLQRSGLPAELDKWISPGGPGTGIARDIASLEVSLGPNGSYFALDKDGQSWAGLPKELDERIAERREGNDWVRDCRPRNVSLGPDDTFIFMTSGGAGTWYLGNEYPELSNELDQDKTDSLKQVNIVLDPHRPGCFLLVRLDGTHLKKLAPSMVTPCDEIMSKLPDWKAQAEQKKLSHTHSAEEHTSKKAETHSRHKKEWMEGVGLGATVLGAVASVAAAITGSSSSGGGGGGGGS